MATYPLKKYRLKGNEFIEVLKKGKSFRVNGLIAKIMFKNSEKKFGFLISKKILKKAVKRNKLKRRLREMLREKVEIIKEGVRIVFIPLKGIEEKNFRELKVIFEKILRKSEILNESNLPNL
jgi:ribonuclease P protein component